MTDRYAAPPPDLILSAPLDGLTALYHRPSGQTHVVAEPVPEMLAALAGQALSLDELLAALAIDTPDAEDRAGLLGHLEPLIANGLVART